jgi:hypothetical protein
VSLNFKFFFSSKNIIITIIFQGIDTINILTSEGSTVKKTLFSFILPILCFSIFTNADSLTAVDLEEVVTLSPGGAELRLKGKAIKSNARQAIYVGGLYLENDGASVDEVIENQGAKRFLLKTDDSISPDSMIRAINLGINVNHTEQELVQIAPLLKQFNAIWKSGIDKGDEVCIDYDPVSGTSVSINGVEKGNIPGALFYKAFLKTWLGDKPLNTSIKNQLMGN